MQTRIVSSLLAFSLAFVMIGSSARAADWPQFEQSPQHTSYAADPAISTSNASSIGIKWMANLYGPALDSPVVAYNATLGKSVVYTGNEKGQFFAFDASNGQLLWSDNLGYGDSVRSTPAVAPDGSVWVGTVYNPTLYKLDGATGNVLCSSKAVATIDGSIMIVTPPGQSETVYYDVNNNASGGGPTVSVNESNCAVNWSFANYSSPDASSWTTPSFMVDANGEPLIFVGSTDPDQHEYAIDAVSGKYVWSYYPTVGGTVWDLGAATTVSPIGNNGFPNGVIYFQTKYGIEYAADPATGSILWQYSMTFTGGARDARSGAALDGSNLVFGYQDGIDSVNAATGALNWFFPTPLEVISSPAIVGPSGSETVSFGDISGAFRVLALANGSQLYSHQTGGFISSSPAESNGNVYINSSDGFLYDFAPNGNNASAPASAIATPVNLSTVKNPNGSLTLGGSATDATGVAAVNVAIQENGGEGQWYNGATNSWVAAPVPNAATLSSPGSTNTNWTYDLPVPGAGGTYEVFVSAVNASSIASKMAVSTFNVSPGGSSAYLTIVPDYAAPGTVFNIRGHAFAPGEKVQISLFGNVVATITASSTGYVSNSTVVVPSTAPFGPTTVGAVGLTSGKTSTAPLYVTNEWTQLGGNPMRTSFEPHDNVLVNVLDLGQGTVLQQAWDYPTGAAINSSPAIVNGTAYFGNDAGIVSAVVTASGAAKWTYKIPSGAPIRSSPAVDSAGNIVFGANDGNLYFVTSNGSLATSSSLGGILTSPAYNGSQIYVSSDNGALYDVADPSGTVTWRASLAGPSHSSPAYDVKYNTVVVGDDAGAITAFNATTGSQMWQMTTGGKIVATPAIFNGTVFVGSQDGYFYAINEQTGALKWKYQADSGIASNAAINGIGTLEFGSANGTFYSLTINGTVNFTQPKVFGSSQIVGVAAITNNEILETAAGLVAGTRLDAGMPQYPYFKAQTGNGLSTQPVILDGAVYVGAQDGALYAYTPHGANPVPAARKGGVNLTVTNSPWVCSAMP